MDPRSIIGLPSDFVVIDTETTGLDFDSSSIIELAAIKYVDNKKVDYFASLVKPNSMGIFAVWAKYPPYRPCRYVPPYISELTGISEEMVCGAPPTQEVLPRFLEFIGDSVLVGQNISFDVRFISDACNQYSLPSFQNQYINIARIARKLYPGRDHYRLSDIAEMCGIPQNTAHRALADCIVTANCYLSMQDDLLSQMSEDEFIALFKKRRTTYERHIHSICLDEIEIDEDSPIYGKTVVFTGALEKMLRKDALTVVAKLGGIPSNSITKSTNYLVVGNCDFVKSIKEGKTSKMVKAESMAAKGADISVISENTFYEMIHM